MLTRPPPCHSKAFPMRLPPRVPCVHPSTPLTPSPPHQFALTAHFTLRTLAQSPSPPHQFALTAHFTLCVFSRNHLLLHTSVLSPLTSTCALSRALTPALARTSTHACRSPLWCDFPHNCVLPRPPWRARRKVAVSNALACRQLPHCRNRRYGSAQKSPVCCCVQQTSPR